MKAVPLDRSFWKETGRHVGVALAEIPEAEVFISTAGTSIGYGRSMILTGDAEYTEHPLRLHETWALRQASKEFRAQGFEVVQDLIANGLSVRGFTAFKVDKPINVGTLQQFRKSGSDGVYECRDYRGMGESMGADYLFIVRLEHYGTICRYIDLNNYEVEVYVEVRAQMIETATNRVLWRNGMSEGRFTRIVTADCSRPDQVPIILDALKSLLGDAAKEVSRQFFSSSDNLERPARD